LTLTTPSAEQIRKLQKERGVDHLFQAGLKKVREGVTTLEELSRALSAETE
jgi:type II secretory ATPase GspE/PulE/Tfp pilus assembly ATPase PilB-like protein